MAPSLSYAWSEDFSSSGKRSATTTNTKWVVLMIRLIFVAILTSIMFVFGVLEADALERRGQALLQAEHDSTCYMHVYPYDDTGGKLNFFVTGGNTAFVSTVDLHGNTTSGSMTQVQFGIDFSYDQRLTSKQCDLLMKPSRDGSIRFYHFEANSQTALEAVDFKICKDLQGGEPVSFRVVDRSGMTGLAAWALVVWISLRLLQIARDVSCIPYDARYPPTTKDVSKGCCVPCPLSFLLKKATGGTRLVCGNIYRTGLRPFVLYGVLLAIVIRPFTTIKLHDDCPQLVMQTGDASLTVAAICLGTTVTLVGALDWCIDLWSWKGQWHKRFEEDNDCEHSHRWQGSTSTCLCLFVLLLVIVKFFLHLSFDFVVELRWLFVIKWPNYAVANWSHGMRILALVLFMVDSAAFLMKFVAKGERMDEAQKMKASGYSVQEMKEKGVNAWEVKAAGYTASEIAAAGYSASDMKAADYSTSTLKALGYSASEMKEAGCEAEDMKAAGYTTQDMKFAGYAAQDMHAVGCTNSEMKAAGYTALEMRTVGLKTMTLKELGYTGLEMRAAGYKAPEMKFVGYTSLQMKAGGYEAPDMKAAGYQGTAMRDAGYAASEMKGARFTAEEMRSFGYTSAEMKSAGYGTWGMRAAGYAASEMVAAGYTPSEMKAAGFTALEMKPVLIKPQKMKAMGYTASEMKNAKYRASDLKSCYTASQMNAGGYAAEDMRAAGFKSQELKVAGYVVSDMKAAGYTPSEMKAAGYTASEMNLAGYTPLDMKAAGYTALEIQALGYTASQMKSAGF